MVKGITCLGMKKRKMEAVKKLKPIEIDYDDKTFIEEFVNH